MPTLVDNLLKGELPEVKMNISLDRETLTDIAITAIIVAVLVTLLNKFLLSKI
ncbi:hypothetical protein I5M32_11230 [Pedobacter sp. SD-b]|uniref:Uncharacterized protein n=1 Tax=Pedobacter segetis TaxID=2793069 RepID=A0ABS1BMV7_9SPHI|nr:hypothetical protein [Pedobacter segetis]MBK0383529.1 hypothetical protein [Pedobacter segetis]